MTPTSHAPSPAQAGSSQPTPRQAPAEKPRSFGAPLWLRTIVSVLIIAGSLYAGSEAFRFLSSMKVEPPREEPQPPVFRVEAFAVQSAPLQRYVSAFGTAHADRQVTVAAEVAGRITQTQHLKVGHSVRGERIEFDATGKSIRRAGDVIVQIDPQTYHERVNQIQTLLAKDAADLEKLEQDHLANQRLLNQQLERLQVLQEEVTRQENLQRRNAGTATNLDRARLELQQHQEAIIRTQNEVDLYEIRKQQWATQKNSHESDLILARLDLEKAAVRAPFSGVLREVFVEEGQYVRPGDPLVTITDFDVVEVPVPVPLEDASILGQLLQNGRRPYAELATREAAFTDEAERKQGHIWRGEVRRLAPNADEQTRTIMAYVEVNNREQAAPLRPGTFVHARLQAEMIDPSAGVMVPRDAIVAGTVFVVKELQQRAPDVDQKDWVMQCERRPVLVLRKLQTFALVQGVQPGESIVMTNLDVIGDGSFLNVRKVNTLRDEFDRLHVPYLQIVESTASRQ